MALNYVTLICDLGAGDGYYLTSGTGLLIPSAVVTDTADHIIVSKTPVPVTFGAPGPPQARLLATDNAALQPAGWAWTFTPPAGSGIAPFSFFLPFSGGATQYLSAQIPVSSVAAMQAYMPLPSGTAAAGQVPVAAGTGGASAWATAFGLQPSGDTSGTADTAAISARIAAIGGSGGTVYLAPGAWYVKCGQITASAAGVSIEHLGPKWACIVHAVGTGAAFRMYTTSSYQPGNVTGGGLKGFIIDGAGAGAGSCGFRIGDGYQLQFDVGVRNFQGAGSKGAWFDNNYWWCEQLTGKIWAEQCTSNVVFDNSANTSGFATGSYDRAVLDIFLDAKDKGDGVVFQNGAFMINHDLGIFGNIDSSALPAAPFAVVTVTGQNASNYSYLDRGTLRWGVELNTNNHTLPYPVKFGTPGPAGNYIQGCTGLIDFSGNFAMAQPLNAGENFQFDGPVFGVGGSMGRTYGIAQAPFQQGALSNGQTIVTRYNSVTRVTTSGNVTGIALSGFDPLSGQVFWLINDGTGSITFAAQGTSKVVGGTTVSVAPNSAALFIWNDNQAAWFPVTVAV